MAWKHARDVAAFEVTEGTVRPLDDANEVVDPERPRFFVTGATGESRGVVQAVALDLAGGNPDRMHQPRDAAGLAGGARP